jgi:hypothetical protein
VFCTWSDFYIGFYKNKKCTNFQKFCSEWMQKFGVSIQHLTIYILAEIGHMGSNPVKCFVISILEEFQIFPKILQKMWQQRNIKKIFNVVKSVLDLVKYKVNLLKLCW